jgi:transposase, IS5 family
MDMFRSHFDQILNPDHPLVILADKINGERFDVAFAECYCPDFGAPGKSIRLMVGLHYLKHAFNESDESVVEWLSELLS